MQSVRASSLFLGVVTVFLISMAPGHAAGGAKVSIQGNPSFVATGTVSSNSVSTTVTGTGTAFLTEVQIGDRVQISAESKQVTAVSSNVSLTVSSPFSSDSTGASMTVYAALLRVDNSTSAAQVLVTDLGNMHLGSVSSATPRLIVYQANRFGGTSTPASLNSGNVVVTTTGSQGADVGGVISLAGSRGATQAVFAGFRGAKENGTIDDARGYLGLYTTDSGNTFAERVRIGSTGNLGIGTTNPGQKIEVNGGVRLNTATARPTCDATVRGTFWATQQGTGVADIVEVCVKDATDAYLWKSVF